MVSNEDFDGLDQKQDIKYFLALTEITSACRTIIRNEKMAVLGILCSTAIPDLVWQCGNKTYFKAKKTGVEQMLIFFFPLPFSLLFHDCDFTEVPGVTSDSCCRQL